MAKPAKKASTRPRFVRLAVAFVLVMALAGGDAAAAVGEPLAGLRTWAAATQDALGRGAGDRAVERRIARLRRVVPALAGRLRTATPRRQRAALRHAREALGRYLEPVAARLDFRQRWFFYTAYQAELERLTHWVGLLRAPTGEVRLPPARPPTPAEVLATLPDSDGDGRLDALEHDDDADGAADARDGFDHGWGIPDALQAREDPDGDADEDGLADPAERPRRVHSPCVFATEPIPAFRTVRRAARWLGRAERRRGCRLTRRAPRRRGGQTGRDARLRGVSLSSGRIEGRTLRLRVRARRPARLSVAVLDGGRVVAGRAARRVRPGRRTLALRLERTPPRGLLVARVSAGSGDAALMRVQSGPAPLPAAVTYDPPLPPGDLLAAFGPPGTGCTDPTDSDQDGVPDCQETAGFQFRYYPPGQKTPSTVAVTSDPHNPNTDADAVTVGGNTFALPDGAEWTSSLSGGTGDPSRKDSDSDGLGDVEEHYRWGTDINAMDTDGDSIPAGGTRPEVSFLDGAELANAPQPTSPTLADTDGDALGDLVEETSTHTNPRVAQVPTFAVYPDPNAPGVTISIPEASGTDTVASTLEDSQQHTEFTDHTSDETINEKTSDWHLNGKGGCGIAGLTRPRGEGGCVPFGEIEVGGGQEWTDTTTHTHQTDFTQSSQRSAQQSYERSTHVELKETGSLLARFVVENTSDTLAVQVKSLGVGATTVCLPVISRSQGCLGPGRVTPVATLAPQAAPPDGITLAPGETRTLTFAASVDTPLLQSLLANPGNLSFTPEGFELWTADGKSNYAALIGTTIATRTGGLTIDYDDGRVESYRVATTVDRAWGAPGVLAGITAHDALAGAVGIDYATQVNPPPAQQRKILTRVRDKLAKPLGPNGEVPGAWFALGSASGINDPNRDFDAIALLPQTHLRLAFLADNDADFLFDRQERLLGSSDRNADTDGDGATAPLPPPAKGNYGSDYFEASVGWLVPYPTQSESYRAYASPVSCDGDADGSPDGPGQGSLDRGGCPSSAYPPELQRTTDPTNRDTNANGIEDGKDPNPLQPPPTPVTSGQWTGQQMQATTGVPISDTGWQLGVGGEIRPPLLALCGTGGAGPACQRATGYYRLTWTLGPTPRSAKEGAGPSVGHWRAASRNPSDPDETTWLTLPRTWLPQDDFAHAHPAELYFHLTGNQQNVALTYTADYMTTLIEGAKLEPITKAEYLTAAVGQDGQPNPRFAGIAFPAQDLVQAKGAAAVGPQGVRIDGPAQGQPDFALAAWGPPGGFNIPAGGFRAGFQMRIANTSVEDDIVASAGVTQGAGDPPQEALAAGLSGLTSPTATRYPLVGGHVWRADFFAPGQPRVFNLLFDQRAPTQNLSFPVSASPSSGALTLDNVVLGVVPDIPRLVTPDPQWPYAGLPYSGLGFSGWTRLDWMHLYNYASRQEPQFLRLSRDNQGSAYGTITFPTAGRWARWQGVIDVDPADRPCGDPWLLVGSSNTQENRSPPTGVSYAVADVDARSPNFFSLTAQPYAATVCGTLGMTLRQAFLANRPPPPTGVAIAGAARYTRSRRVRLTLQPPPGATAMELSSDPLFRRSRSMPVRRRMSWLLGPGHERAPRRVFARFSGPGVDPREVVSDAILVDRSPPRGRARARTLGGHRVLLRAVAADSGSGPAAMQVRVGRRTLRWQRLRRNIVLGAPSRRLAIRFRDRAGNVSPWTPVRRPGR
jgi:hypothetical protein